MLDDGGYKHKWSGSKREFQAQRCTWTFSCKLSFAGITAVSKLRLLDSDAWAYTISVITIFMQSRYSPNDFSLQLIAVTILPSPMFYLSCCSFCSSADNSNSQHSQAHTLPSLTAFLFLISSHSLQDH